jgi:hypothetical protein
MLFFDNSNNAAVNAGKDGSDAAEEESMLNVMVLMACDRS